MIERDIDIRTPDGAMNSFVVHPDQGPEEGGPHPVVLFYMDAPGKREELHDMARRIAAVGYHVVLPNLYYRTTREFVMVRDEDGYKRMFDLLRGLSIEMVMRDTAALLEFVDGEPAARARSIGTVGYCMSGPFVFAAAARFPDRIQCAASIYGAGLVTDRPDSPHLTMKQIRGEMYFACAEIDKYAPKPQIDALEAQLETSGIRYRLEWYPGAEHGFAFPQRAGIYHQPSAERHWERLFALFRRNLG
ncbi:MAG TPA: dienelactone hydrolase family protein [Kofleriaceae bacterium]|jgi:carboxymethylenebutenolidase|nr:dienelactone hydrolase family protein [Kofleriaceae bacterium]